MLDQQVHGKPLIYLDSAATSLKPRCVINAVSNFYANHYGTVHRSLYSTAQRATERFQGVREKVGTFLNCSEKDEVIFTSGTTDGINLVAHSYCQAVLQPGDEILISETEHHANIVPWQIACRERGAILKVIHVGDDGELDLERFEQLLTERTKLVAIAHVVNSIGTVNPIEKVIDLAHRKGVKVLIDGAQAVSHMPVDLSDLNPDFYVFSGHKLFAPTGVGVLVGKRELLEKMPPYKSGGAMIDQVTFEETTYLAPPERFEAGTPMIAQVIGLGAAIDFIDQIGMEQIAQHEAALMHLTLDGLKEIPEVEMIGAPKERAGAVSFTVKGAHPLDVATFLDFDGIAVRSGHHCAQPAMKRFGVNASIRVSFSIYNTKEEILFFLESLKRVIHGALAQAT